MPHHLLAADLIARGYWAASAGHYRRIIVISPDHFHKVRKAFGTSREDLATVFGPLASDRQGVEAVAAHDDLVEVLPTIAHEHGVMAEAPFIAHFFPGAEVIFDTTGFWLPAAVPALATFGCIAIIAAPVDGQVQLPALALYRRGGSVIGSNTLLYDTRQSAAMLDGFGQLFDQGALPAPGELREVPLSEGPICYRAVDEGRTAKFIFLP